MTLTVSQGGHVYITKTTRAAGAAGVGLGRAEAAASGFGPLQRDRLTRAGTNTIKLIGTQFDGTGTLVLTAPRVNVRGGAYRLGTPEQRQQQRRPARHRWRQPDPAVGRVSACWPPARCS